ncbi:MAG: hypothetical protein ACLP7I_12040 [Limisphaerales bacterium]
MSLWLKLLLTVFAGFLIFLPDPGPTQIAGLAMLGYIWGFSPTAKS